MPGPGRSEVVQEPWRQDVTVGGQTNWDPYQKAMDTASSSVPWKPPVPLFFDAG